MAGHLYLQTNEVRNSVVHFRWAGDGQITEVGRHLTGGAGAGSFNYLTDLSGLVVEGANSVLLTPEHRFLFAANVGDNSVSSFRVGADGQLELLDVRRTGNVVSGRSGTAKSLAYAASTRTLYVLHTDGPSHIRLMSVGTDGMLAARPEGYGATPADKPHRITTMLTLAPDERFLLVGAGLDELPARNPDGSPILWVQRDGRPHVIAANAPDPDGLAVFAVAEDGALGDVQFQDAGGASPFCPVFLQHRPSQFVLGYAGANGVSLGTLGADGTIATSPVVPADTSAGRLSELCWVTVTPDDQLVFATMTGYSYITSWHLSGAVLSIARDPACPKVPGDGTFRGIAGVVGAGPNDMWMTPDGAFLYQIYGNASKLVGYAVHPDGSLEEVTSASIPRNSPQGVAGF
jgi:6-phosphogluconolactonase (cycloisomerase 2 family)